MLYIQVQKMNILNTYVWTVWDHVSVTIQSSTTKRKYFQSSETERIRNLSAYENNFIRSWNTYFAKQFSSEIKKKTKQIKGLLRFCASSIFFLRFKVYLFYSTSLPCAQRHFHFSSHALFKVSLLYNTAIF